MLLSSVNPNLDFCSFAPSSPCNVILSPLSRSGRFAQCLPSSPLKHKFVKPLHCFANLKKSDPKSTSSSSQNLDSDAKTRTPRQKAQVDQSEDRNLEKPFPATIPKKPRRGRRSEAAAVEDFVRGSLERTFTTIREQNSEILEDKEDVLKDRVVDDESDSDGNSEGGEDENGKGGEKKMVIEEESSDWPLDADVGWGVRASEYFEQHPIRNVVGEDGVEIDWEGELDDSWVKEINCLEWETFAFHPSQLIVLVFERYNRDSDNWKILKELEKAVNVYWSSNDRLPPRAVKLDINIEKDMAYALKVREGPQLLFLRGNKILYREKDIRTADELVQMIAHFYYKAKKPSFVNVEA